MTPARAYEIEYRYMAQRLAMLSRLLAAPPIDSRDASWLDVGDISHISHLVDKAIKEAEGF